MSYNTGPPKIKTLNQTVPTTVEDFKYLGSHLRDTEEDMLSMIVETHVNKFKLKL
jgi:hypothetical protein